MAASMRALDDYRSKVAAAREAAALAKAREMDCAAAVSAAEAAVASAKSQSADAAIAEIRGAVISDVDVIGDALRELLAARVSLETAHNKRAAIDARLAELDGAFAPYALASDARAATLEVIRSEIDAEALVAYVDRLQRELYAASRTLTWMIDNGIIEYVRSIRAGEDWPLVHRVVALLQRRPDQWSAQPHMTATDWKAVMAQLVLDADMPLPEIVPT